MKLWGGRFTQKTDSLAQEFNESLSFDQRFWRQDIRGSIAHATMLADRKIISEEDRKAILQGLTQIAEELENGTLTFENDSDYEDIHSFIEGTLTERIGDAGKRLHTGRSRNDQVALDMKLYIRDEIDETGALLTTLLSEILKIMEENTDTVMPGFTHLQKAQPTTLAHHFGAYFEMFLRDRSRMNDCRKRLNLCPLGAGAFAGTTYPLDRDETARLLDFDGPTRNSMDSVSDRDYLIEYLSDLAMTAMHLSRLAEEIIIWNTNEYRFVEIADTYSTGSSIMPQKKNPDIAELIRGKTGRVYGALTGLLTVMKGLPLAYNKDMQEDKEAFFDARDTLVKGLTVFTAMLKTVTFRKEEMERGASGGFTNATDCADYLVKKGLPFRDAHRVVGELVAYCLNEKKALLDLSLEELQKFHPAFGEDVFEDLSMISCVEKRDIPGAPAPARVQQAIDSAREKLKN